MNMRHGVEMTAIALAVVVAGQGVSAQQLTEMWRTGGFVMPESVWSEPATGQLVVSNIGVFGPDGGTDGSLSLMSADGTVEAADWVTGLVDPKGMASHEGLLYVADAPGLQVVDIASGVLVRTVPLPGAMFPNDVAIGDDGAVYVTDMMGNGILRVVGDAVDWLVPQGGIALPNGILWADGRLVVGSFGDEMKPDFTVNAPGGLYRVDPASGDVTPVSAAQGVASVDGMVTVGDMIVYDDNPSGTFFALQGEENITLGVTAPGAADLGVDGDMIFVPFLSSGEVVAYRVE
jgi:hypothetical protein